MTPYTKAMKVIAEGGFNANQVLVLMAGKFPQEFLKLTETHKVLHGAAAGRPAISNEVVLTTKEHEEFLYHLHNIGRVASIKYIRRATGAGLKFAKDYMDRFTLTPESGEPDLKEHELHHLRQLLKSDKKVAAIMYVRDVARVGLKEAKNYVDTIHWTM